MPKILLKHSPNIDRGALYRQLPTDFYYANPTITFVSDDCDDYDWVVFLHHSSVSNKFISKVPRSQCIYISMEPSESICNVSNDFLRQFGTIVSPDKSLDHENQIYYNVHTWWIGLDVRLNKGSHKISYNSGIDYDFLKNKEPLKKANRVSTISSSKIIFDGHRTRNNLISDLSVSEISDSLDIFGNGYNRFTDKYDIISDRMFHLVVENTRCENYWSEKIADVYLADSMPIYYGCPNISNYFDKDSLVILESLESEYVISAIKRIIHNEGLYFNSESIKKAKVSVIDKYNFFNFISSCCFGSNLERSSHVIKTNTYFVKGLSYEVAKNIYKTLSRIC